MNRVPSLLLLALVIAAPLGAATTFVSHAYKDSIPRGAVDRVVIDIDGSEVEITSGGERIEIEGTVEKDYSKTSQIGGFQKAVDATSLGIRVEGSRAILERRYGPDAASRSAKKNLRHRIHVRVPVGTNVEVRQDAGVVRVRGTFGDVLVHLTSGEVSVDVPRTSVREIFARARVGASTTNLGGETVTREGLFAGVTHYFNEGGKGLVDVRVRFGEIAITLL